MATAVAAEEQAPTAVSDEIHRTNSAGSNGSTFSQKKRFELADLLRDCAALVEQREMDQLVFQRMFRELTEYVSVHGGGKGPDSSITPPGRSSDVAGFQTPFDEPDMVESVAPPAAATSTMPPPAIRVSEPLPKPPSARKVTTTTTVHIPPPSAPSTSSRGTRDDDSSVSKREKVDLFAKIKSVAKEAGSEFSHIAHTGQRALSQAAKNATSAKNAERARTDIAAELNGDKWCEEHFTMGCGCKTQKRPVSASQTPARSHTPSVTPSVKPVHISKPPFQRPVNPNSTLIANGWLEQHRRSKMRFVWKEVLVSLVAGRRPGEETTLWIQREVTNPLTGNSSLEALHQIPIKAMQDIHYVDFSTDHRFVIQVYNLSDQFEFRTRDNGDAAKNWVSTLRLTREAILNGIPPPKAGDLQTASQRTKTHPSYTEDEKKADSPQQQQPQPQQPPQSTKALSVKELRAIAHGHGVNTAGMERQQLEAAVAKIQQKNEGRTTPPTQEAVPRTPGPAPTKPPTSRTDKEDESERKAEAERRARQLKLDEETAVRLAAEERERAEAERRRVAAEQQKAAEAEEHRRRQHAEYLRQQEIQRQQQAQAAAQAKWQEDQRRAEEQRRYQQQQQYFAQQQAAQQKWQEEQRRYQQQQFYAQQQAQQQPQFHGQQTPQPPPQGHHPGGHPGQHAEEHPNKWANMAEDQSDGQAVITAIKHHILIQWALQPPTMQMLRPIHALLTAIHTVFPPVQGVPGHEHFKKWKPLSMESLCGESGQPDENKLTKSVKKLRFFLHPDKLPRDLNEEQTFICKMLWDVTSDAWDEYEKHKEELDWLQPS